MKFRYEAEFKETEIGEILRDWMIEKIKKLGKTVAEKAPPTKCRFFVPLRDLL